MRGQACLVLRDHERMFARPQVDRLFTNGRALTRFQSLDAFFFGTAYDLDECHICSQTLHRVLVFCRLAGRHNGIASGAYDAKETYDNRECRERAASLCHGRCLRRQLMRTRMEEEARYKLRELPEITSP